MKKIVLASIVLLSAFFTSCTKSNLVVEPDGANTLRAVMENSDDSRTTLEYNGNVVWSAGDKLSVFNQADQKQQAEYTLIQGEGTTSAVFQSNKPIGAGVKYAFYPASAEVTCAADVISFNLPTTQVYTTASFANGSNPMVAKSNAQGNLSFKNLCGVIKFQLTGTATVAKVVMQTAGEVVAGAMTVKMDYADEPVMKVATTGPTSITLTDCNVSLSESINSTFYFTVPAGTYAPGLTFTAYDKADKMIRTRSISKPLTVSRSRIASLTGVSDKVSFPDARFRAMLVAKGFKLTGDGSDIDITNTANAKLLKDTKELNVFSAQITNLKGIEHFTALTSLKCYSNQLTSLDVSANTKLITLDCSNNQLTSLDVSKNNTTLTTLDCSHNQLALISLILGDNKVMTTLKCNNNKLVTLEISQNTALTTLHCNNNLFKALNLFSNRALTTLLCNDNLLGGLDIDNNIELTSFNCNNNPLSTLGITKNTKLEKFECAGTQLTALTVSNTAMTVLNCKQNTKLTSLTVSGNNALHTLDCSQNALTTLVVGDNAKLEKLFCEKNQLSALDVSKNTALITLWCEANLLTSLNVSANKALEDLQCHTNKLTTLDITTLSSLKYLQCGKQTTGNLTLTLTEPQKALVVGSNNTGITQTKLNFPDAAFRAKLVSDYSLKENAAKTDIDMESSANKLVFANHTTIGVPNSQIGSLAGIENFKALTTLNCSGNALTALDVSNNTQLTTLNCSANQLAMLDLTKNTALTDLDCSDNLLDGNNNTALIIAKCTSLTSLKCNKNKLTALTVSENTLLTTLHCFDNRMGYLKISTLSKLDTPDNLQCGLQTTNGTKERTLLLELLQAQKTLGLGVSTGTNNGRVNQYEK